jgi:hypothetical protein
VGSPETYIGYERAQHFMSPGGFGRGSEKTYSVPDTSEHERVGIVRQLARGRRESRFRLVPAERSSFVFMPGIYTWSLGPGTDGKPVRFRVTVDGQEAREESRCRLSIQRSVLASHGISGCINWYGNRATFAIERLLIEFLDPGIQAYSFTFG